MSPFNDRLADLPDAVPAGLLRLRLLDAIPLDDRGELDLLPHVPPSGPPRVRALLEQAHALGLLRRAGWHALPLDTRRRLTAVLERVGFDPRLLRALRDDCIRSAVRNLAAADLAATERQIAAAARKIAG